jgi:hypothetical protein
MLSLNARDALRRSTAHLQRRERAMSLVLEKCLRFVDRCAHAQRTSCVYEVPEFTIGMPVYKLTDCVAYLYEQLHAREFAVVLLSPRHLMISWGPAPEEAPPPALLPAPPLRRSSPPEAMPSSPPAHAAFAAVPKRQQRQRKPRPSPLLPPPRVQSREGAELPRDSRRDEAQDPFALEGAALPTPTTAARELSTTDGLFVRCISDLKPSGKFCLSLD